MLTRFMKARYVLHSSTLGQLSRLRLKMLRTSGELTAMASSAYAFQCSACMHLHDIDDYDCAPSKIVQISAVLAVDKQNKLKGKIQSCMSATLK